MVMLPSGTFQMGSSPSDFQRDLAFRPPDSFINRLATMLGSPGFRGFPEAETPQHVVTIKQAFAMSKYPVTVAEFAAFVKDTGYTARGDCLILGSGKPHISSGTSWQNDGFSRIGDDPVVCMRVDDTQAYIHWLNKRINRDRKSPTPALYRLPSEAEWEFAARAGTTTTWWWGDQVGRGNTNCDGCDQPSDPGRPTPVGTYRPNPFGLYDILGNVSQAVSDCWNPNYNGAPVDGRPWLSGDCSRRVRRGGSFNNGPWFARAASRSWFEIKATDNMTGFRLVRNMTREQ
jgi:formylglycine-generating enzyme required for sulfatase activity